MKKRFKFVKKRQKILTWLLRLPVRLFFRFFLGFKPGKKIKLKKDENVFILSNHQTDYDPLLISLKFNKPIYYVCTDNIFSNKFAKFVVGTCFGAIPKHKGKADPKCIKQILTIIKENGSVGLFPEGNRTYAEFQFYIDISLAKLIKTCKVPLVLHNIHGGTGIMPRFAKSKRKGPIRTEITKIIYPDEYLKMSDEELLEIIKESLVVYDSEENNKYLSKTRAEYLERMFFVCPCCGKTQTLYSKKEFLYCMQCGLKVEYTEDLHLKSDNINFKFNRLIDWYDYQKKWCLEQNILDGKVIFKDNDVKLYISNVYEPRKLLANGPLILDNNKIVFDNISFDLKNISFASVIRGDAFTFSIDNVDYFVVGSERFNPLKYVLMFNKLDTRMKEKENDNYYTLV